MDLWLSPINAMIPVCVPVDHFANGVYLYTMMKWPKRLDQSAKPAAYTWSLTRHSSITEFHRRAQERSVNRFDRLQVNDHRGIGAASRHLSPNWPRFLPLHPD